MNKPETPPVGAFAIVPCNNLRGALPFWDRMGFAPSMDAGNYIILRGWACEVHLTETSEGWRVPENNPFGVFIRTPEVDAVAARVEDLIVRPGGVLRHREWGIYEFAVGGPDNLLVRVGWPSHLIRTGA
jgi:hypothetical protein